MRKRTVYQKLVQAAKECRGLRLSVDDVWQLGRMDEAISSRAEQDDEEVAMDRLEAQEFIASQSSQGRGEV